MLHIFDRVLHFVYDLGRSSILGPHKGACKES